MFIHNNSIINNLDINDLDKEQDSQFNSLIQNNSFNDIKGGRESGNLFSDSMQNISEIQNINSLFLFGDEDTINK